MNTIILYTNKECVETEIKNNTNCNSSTESEVDINLTKHAKDIYAKNYKMQMKEIKELNK